MSCEGVFSVPIDMTINQYQANVREVLQGMAFIWLDKLISSYDGLSLPMFEFNIQTAMHLISLSLLS